MLLSGVHTRAHTQSASERCVLAARAEAVGFGSGGTVTLILCDAIGSPLGSVPVPFEPGLGLGLLVASRTHAAAAAPGTVFLWCFDTEQGPKKSSSSCQPAAATACGGVPNEAQDKEESSCWMLDFSAASSVQARVVPVRFQCTGALVSDSCNIVLQNMHVLLHRCGACLIRRNIQLLGAGPSWVGLEHTQALTKSFNLNAQFMQVQLYLLAS